jgi:hypothetical protein
MKIILTERSGMARSRFRFRISNSEEVAVAQAGEQVPCDATYHQALDLIIAREQGHACSSSPLHSRQIPE